MDDHGDNVPVHPEALSAEMLLEAQPRALVVTDLQGNIVRWNSGAEHTYRWRRDEVIGRSVFEVLEPTLPGNPVEEVFQSIVDGETVETDVVLRRGDGQWIQVWMSGRPVRDRHGTVVAVAGFSEDVTELRSRQRNAAHLTARLQLALDAGGIGTWRWESESGELFVDPAIEDALDLPHGAFRGTLDTFVDLVHPDDRQLVTTTISDAVTTGTSFDLEHRVLWGDGTVRWIRSTGDVTVDATGAITGAIACAADVTTTVLLRADRERLMAEAVEAADRERTHRERLELLGRVNDALVAAEDHRTAMQGVVSAVVPELGDWCLIYVFPTPSSLDPEMEVAHVDPAMVERAISRRAEYPYRPGAAFGVPAIMRTGRSELLPDLTPDMISGPGPSEPQRLALEEFDVRSIIGVPLIKHGRTLGVIQILMTSGRRRYTEDDLALAEAVAARVASKLDNIRLSEYRHGIATTLQQSLLPDDLPSIPGVDVAVCYTAAGEAVEVGGDFYDVFALDDDTWAIAIGDVCGTGPGAAAITGLARHTVASTAWLGLGPDSVLRHLNDTLLRRNADSFLTLAYATMRVGASGLDLELALGGHPPPIVVRSDGSLDEVGTPGSLIGVFDELKVETVPVHLDVGDRIVLYTDGVTDVAPPHDLGADQLIELIGRASAKAESADDLAAAISDALAAILPIEERNDDIALLVLRATPLGDQAT